MRNEQETIEQYRKEEKEVFSFAEDLLEFVTFEAAKEFIEPKLLKDYESGKEKWTFTKPTRANILKKIRDYMEFALGKAEDHRGLSAERSIEHFKHWVWLLGDKDYKTIDWENYTNYGTPILKQICEVYEIDFPEDNHKLVSMSQGKKCDIECEGCGE